MSTDALVAFLATRLDEQHAALIAYRDHRVGTTPCDNLDDYDSCSVHVATAEATPYRDVDYGLAELEAKRRILDECVRTLEYEDYGHWIAEVVLRNLALPYVDHPGYQEEWRP